MPTFTVHGSGGKLLNSILRCQLSASRGTELQQTPFPRIQSRHPKGVIVRPLPPSGQREYGMAAIAWPYVRDNTTRGVRAAMEAANC